VRQDPAPEALVIGGGPAGLMAAEVLSLAGIRVDLYDAMPSLGRKFLLAGVGGLNLTHGEAYERFCSRYAEDRTDLQSSLDDLPPQQVRAWAQALGIETFVGSSGRVFPLGMKAAPLLRAWLHRLRASGVRMHARHRWLGWHDDGSLRIAYPGGELTVAAPATVLALGGASWPQLGSDGAWTVALSATGAQIAPFEPANCGFEVAWSTHLRTRFAGAPLKSVAIALEDTDRPTNSAGEPRIGELVITEHGLEGGLIYASSRHLRRQLSDHGRATFTLDLLPQLSAAQVLAGVCHPQGARSLSSHLQSRLGLKGVKTALLHEVLRPEQLTDRALLAATIKAVPITVRSCRPLAEAISSAGGVRFTSVDRQLMLHARPGVFVAGEMLDWEAPTGGYLLTACLATGKRAGQGALAWLREPAQHPASGSPASGSLTL
jgi:uncharacterized flavoprotein (TIGR03862 family)